MSLWFMVDLCDNIFYKGVVGAVLILHHGLECFKQRPLEASFSILEHKVDKVADTAVGVVSISRMALSMAELTIARVKSGFFKSKNSLPSYTTTSK